MWSTSLKLYGRSSHFKVLPWTYEEKETDCPVHYQRNHWLPIKKPSCIRSTKWKTRLLNTLLKVHLDDDTVSREKKRLHAQLNIHRRTLLSSPCIQEESSLSGSCMICQCWHPVFLYHDQFSLLAANQTDACFKCTATEHDLAPMLCLNVNEPMDGFPYCPTCFTKEQLLPWEGPFIQVSQPGLQ